MTKVQRGYNICLYNKNINDTYKRKIFYGLQKCQKQRTIFDVKIKTKYDQV